MPSSCSVSGCSARCNTTIGIRNFNFLAFPQELWIIALNRADPNKPGKLWSPGKGGTVCNRHFHSGAPVCDPDNIDWVPTLHILRPFHPQRRSVGDRLLVWSVVGNANLLKIYPMVSENIVYTCRLIGKITT